jgi:hypothetical protein
VAERLIDQENPLPGVAALIGYTPTSKTIIKQQMINHVAFQTVTASLLYGGHMVCFAQMEVAVTQRYHRLYMVAAVVYRSIAGVPPAGEGDTPTATPEGGAFDLSQRPIVPAPMATVVPEGLAHGFSVRPAASRSSDEPVPLPTDRERGNLCRTSDDAGLVFLDKNCAGAYEANILVQAIASMRIAGDGHAPGSPGGP